MTRESAARVAWHFKPQWIALNLLVAPESLPVPRTEQDNRIHSHACLKRWHTPGEFADVHRRPEPAQREVRRERALLGREAYLPNDPFQTSGKRRKRVRALVDTDPEDEGAGRIWKRSKPAEDDVERLPEIRFAKRLVKPVHRLMWRIAEKAQREVPVAGSHSVSGKPLRLEMALESGADLLRECDAQEEASCPASRM